MVNAMCRGCGSSKPGPSVHLSELLQANQPLLCAFLLRNGEYVSPRRFPRLSTMNPKKAAPPHSPMPIRTAQRNTRAFCASRRAFARRVIMFSPSTNAENAMAA
ncbi:transposase [Pandoraea communis]|uniref:Transposase n=1 Tax=Pandoraea communis TaxID=2508297 RepID=A0A5E4W5B5_9BURK|nr:transposase [Pandoraea communis]